MNCQTIRQHWQSFHDWECDEQTLSVVADHLDSCNECRVWFQQQSEFEDRIKVALCDRDDSVTPFDASMFSFESTAEFTLAVGREPSGECVNANSSPDGSRRAATIDTSPIVISQPVQRRWPLKLFVCGAAIALAVFFAITQWEPVESGNSLPLLSATIHRNLANGSLKPELQSESDLEVEQYFLSRAPFPVRCPPRIDSGFSVSGAGLCELGGHPAAVVVGTVEAIPVSLIVMSKDDATDFGDAPSELNGQGRGEYSDGETNIVLKVYDQNLILAAGATNTQNLERLLAAYGSYHH